MHFPGITFLLLVASLVSTRAMAQDGSERALRWAVAKNCVLRVDGATNVNKFCCKILKYSGTDTLSASVMADGSCKMRGQVSLSVADFDCGNAIMTADLRKTLKAKEYPVLLITFRSLAGVPGNAQSRVTGIVEISLSGVTRSFEIDYLVSRTSGSGLSMTGYRTIKFSDFELKPPRKLGGMIRTEDELRVEFSLKLSNVERVAL